MDSQPSKMEETLRSLGRNLRWLLFSEAVGRALGFGATAILARSFGLKSFGLLTLAFTFAEAFQQLVALSSHEVIVRRVAADARKARPVLFGMLTLQSALAPITFLVAVIVGAVYGGDLAWLIPAGAAIGTLRAVSGSFLAVGAAFDDFRPLSFNGVWRRVALYVGLAAYFLIDATTTTFVWALVAGESLVAGLAVVSVRRYGATSGWVRPTRGDLLSLLRESVSFSTQRWSGLLHTRLDIILLERMIGAEAVGLYGAAYRLLDVFKIVPNLAERTLLPIFSRLVDHPSELREGLARSLKALATIALPLGVGAWVVSDLAVRVVFGANYTGAAQPWAVLMIALVLTSLARPPLVLLRAQKRLGPANIASWAAVLVNLGFNLLWIPQYGILGAAIATAASEALFLAFAGWIIRRELDARSLARSLYPPLVAACAMAAVGWGCVRWGAPILVSAVAVAASYVAGLLAMRGLDPKDRRALRRLLEV